MEKPQTKIAIVGMAGSGKTVLTTVLATKLKQKTDQGVFLTPIGENLRETMKFVQQNWWTLQNGQWPPSTPAGEVANLRWVLKTGSMTAEVRFADFAGQDIHAIFSSDHFNPDQLPEDQRQLFTYLNSANILMFLVNMEDLLGKGSKEALDNSLDLFQMIHRLSQKKDIPRKMAIVFTQYDRYRAEVNQKYNGNLKAYFRANLSDIYNEYVRTGSFELFPVAAVDQTQMITDDRGNVLVVPQRDFGSYNIEELIQWIINGIAELTPSPIKKWAISGILTGVILLGIVLGTLMINTGNQDNRTEMTNETAVASPSVTVPTDVQTVTVPTDVQTVTVPTDVQTVAEAYEKVTSNGTITILRGKYDVPATITITKNVTIKGDVEHPENVVLQGGEESVFHLQSGFADIAGLTIQNEGKEGLEAIPKDKKSAFATRYSALVVSSPLGVIRDCVFVSRHCCGFIVNTKDSNPNVNNCTAKNSGLIGFYIGSGASGTFRKCTASGNAYSGMAVIDALSNPIVEDCHFTDGKGNGIVVLAGACGTFLNCTASGNASAGIQVRNTLSNPTVENCTFENNRGSGVYVYDGASGVFTKCTASGNTYSGMAVRDANTNPTVEDCQFTGGKQNGIIVLNGASGTFRKCTVSGNALLGMEVRDANTNPTVEGCQFTNGKNAGVFIWNGASGTFRKCTASGNSSAGMQVRDANTNPTVEGCQFTNGKDAGIFVLEGASGMFRKCTTSGNSSAGMQVRDANTNPSVEDCHFTEGNDSGITVLAGASGTFQNCIASGNAKAGMAVRDVNTNPTVEGCQFTNGKDAGILVLNGASGTFRNCTVSGNANSGMEVRVANTNPTVEDCQFTDGKQSGIFVWKGASGTFRNCTASGNAKSGMEVGDANTNPTVEDSMFEKNQGSGVYVYNGASGTFRRNKLSGNSTKFGNWFVTDATSDLVREGNTPNR